MIPFHKSFITGSEITYIIQAIERGDLRGDGFYSEACETWLETNLDTGKALLTPSCTSALELAALLLDLNTEDEVIIPSFTFPSTANAFLLRGAKIKFIDIRPDTLNLDENQLEDAITQKTKVICPVHYAGVSCEMDKIMSIANTHNAYVVEDAAHAIFSKYKEQSLGGIGHIGTFSFHETKNISCGEGGAIILNSSDLIERAEIIREKGTNRTQYFRGEINKYSWVDIGSSYLLSELIAAYLYAKLELASEAQKVRLRIWNTYYQMLGILEEQGYLKLPVIPNTCEHNAHIFHILAESEKIRDSLISYLEEHGVNCVFHYIPLHKSAMGKTLGYQEGDFPISEDASKRIIRLPLYNALTDPEVLEISKKIIAFFK